MRKGEKLYHHLLRKYSKKGKQDKISFVYMEDNEMSKFIIGLFNMRDIEFDLIIND